jgi:hypothetical protein
MEWFYGIVKLALSDNSFGAGHVFILHKRGSSTSSSTQARTSQQLQLLHLASKTQMSYNYCQVDKKTVDWLQPQFWADNQNWINSVVTKKKYFAFIYYNTIVLV